MLGTGVPRRLRLGLPLGLDRLGHGLHRGRVGQRHEQRLVRLTESELLDDQVHDPGLSLGFGRRDAGRLLLVPEGGRKATVSLYAPTQDLIAAGRITTGIGLGFWSQPGGGPTFQHVDISPYVVPRVTVPLLTPVLGPQQYGRLSFVLAVTTYFINLVNYSFDLTATPRVALARDKVERSSIFWTTISAQWLITVAGFAVLVAMTSLIPYFEAERTALLLEFGMAIGAALTPGWYFQGIQKLSVFSMTACRSTDLTYSNWRVCTAHILPSIRKLTIKPAKPVLMSVSACHKSALL